MPLFGLTIENVNKMEAKMDTKGLINALAYKKDLTVRRRAIEALERICDIQAVPALIIALKDKDYYLRHKAAYVIGKIVDIHSLDVCGLTKTDTSQLVLVLLELLRENYRENLIIAIRTLGKIGQLAIQSIPQLIQLLNSEKDISVEAEKALSQFCPLNLNTVAKGLESSNIRICLSIIDILGGLGSDGKLALPFLYDALNNPIEEIKNSTIVAIKKIQPDETALPHLVKALANTDKHDPIYYSNIRDLIVSIGLKPVPQLTQLLKHNYKIVRLNIAQIIKEQKYPETLPYLIEGLCEQNSSVLRLLLEAIKELDTTGNETSAQVYAASIKNPNLTPDFIDFFNQLPSSLITNDMRCTLKQNLKEFMDKRKESKQKTKESRFKEKQINQESFMREFIFDCGDIGYRKTHKDPAYELSIPTEIIFWLECSLTNSEFVKEIIELRRYSLLSEEFLQTGYEAFRHLCNIKSQLTNNMLHLIEQKPPKHCCYPAHSTSFIDDFRELRNRAEEELCKRGNPPYQSELNYDKTTNDYKNMIHQLKIKVKEIERKWTPASYWHSFYLPADRNLRDNTVIEREGTINVEGIEFENSGPFEELKKYGTFSGDDIFYHKKGISLFKLNQFEEALNYYDKALQHYSSDSAWSGTVIVEHVLSNKGMCLYKLNRFEEALNYYNESIEKDSEYPNVWFNKAIVEKEIGRNVEAIESFKEFLILAPFNWTKEINYAKASVKKLESISYVTFETSKEKIENLPSNIQIINNSRRPIENPETKSLINEGIELGRLGRFDESINCFEKALKIDPHNSKAWYNKGLSLSKLSHFQEALVCYGKALEKNPNHAEALYNKALIEEKLGQKLGSKLSFRAFLNVAPEDWTEEIKYAKESIQKQ